MEVLNFSLAEPGVFPHESLSVCVPKILLYIYINCPAVAFPCALCQKVALMVFSFVRRIACRLSI